MVMFKKSKLRSAIERGDATGVKEMRDLGVNPNYADQYARSFLWYAINHGNRDAVELLIGKGATVDAEIRYDGTLLHMAARKGSVEIATMLLEKTPALLQLKDKTGNTALHEAAAYGYPEFVDFMIRKGLDPNQKNFENRTALSLAQKASQTEVAELLKPYAPVRTPVETALADTEQTPPPAALPPAPAQEDPWKKLPGERIARIAVEEAIGYRITEIFNFSAREKTTLYHNLDTKSETVETRGFSDLGDRSTLETALAELQKRGGRSDVSSISGIDKKKISHTP